MKKATHLFNYPRKIGLKLNEIPLISQLLERQELKGSFVLNLYVIALLIRTLKIGVGRYEKNG